MGKTWNKVESRTLVYGGTWEDAQSTIRATVFGVMVELGRDRIKHYRSDLYHDSIWISENLTGPMQFEWIARESGTHIGEVCLYVKDEDWPKSVRYRFDIREDGDRKWVLDIHEAGNQVTSTPTDVDYSENEAYQIQLEKEFQPYFSNESLSENVRETVEEQKMTLFPNGFPSEQGWADRHAALDISECDVAFAAEGCIFHPAPVNGWTECTGYYNNGSLQHDGDTCPSHEIPTLRNESTRKDNNMDQILRDLRDKLDEANGAKDQLEEYQVNINDAVDELENYLNDLQDVIDTLDQLPEANIYVDLDTISFDS